MDLYQVVLPSGYGIRFRTLTAAEHDKTLINAATITGKDASAAELKSVQWREAIKTMVHSRTKTVCKKAEDLATAEWTPLSTKDLELPGPLEFDKVFGAKDAEALTHLFRTYHELSQEEANAIVGKVQPVSVG